MTRKIRIAAALIVIALFAAACTGPQQASGPTEGGVVGADAETIPFVDLSGPFTVTVFHEQSSSVVDVDLIAPTNAAQVQFGSEPTFANSPWHTVEDLELMTLSTGVQEFFVRYRNSDGTAVGEMQTLALSILPPITPLTETADPDHVRVTRVADDILQIDLIVGEVVYEETGQAWLPGPNLPVDSWWPDQTAVAIDDVSVEVAEMARQSWPVGNIDGDTFALRHRLHIRLAEPIDGSTASVNLSGFESPAVGSVANDAFSPAIRLGELGWGATDEKLGYVTVWSGLGEQITDIAGATARIVDAETGLEALAVTGTRFENPIPEGELWRGDLTGAPTTIFDFSALDITGTYRMCVDDLGCSTPFEITDSGPWQSMAVTVARALYHQRSGIALEQPYTAFDRPRPYHPDDGLTVEASEQTLAEDANGLGDGEKFTELVAARTGTVVDDAWGGHFDAGDWDRRIQHLWAARRLIDLVELFPDTTATLEMNIPESGDDIPDLLDEARWTVDLFMRLQNEDGGIRGGVEAASYSVEGGTSWSEELDVFAYAPDAWSAAIYAGVAADMAFVLETYDPEAAAVYLDSAIRAMDWAEANHDTVSDQNELDVQREIAAVSLYRATGDEAYHDLFAQLTALTTGPVVEPCVLATLCEANWRYATLPVDLGRDTIREHAVASVIDVAEQVLFVGDSTAFGWTPEGPNIQLIWSNGPSIPHTVGIMRAFLLTGDERFRDQAVRNASFALGGNPAGVTYITGVGTENPRQPLLIDQRNSDLPIWPGTPIYGIFTSWQLPDWYLNFFLRDAGATPDPAGWPTLHSFVDQGVFAGHSEFTIQQSHGETIWTFGALHGTVDFTTEDVLVAE